MEGDPHCIPIDFRASYRVSFTSREEDRTFYAEFYIDLEMEKYFNPPIEEHCVGISTTPPAEKDLVSYESRLETFYYWPKYISQTKEFMAEAGFLYSSIGDYVICHHCGNGMKDWKNNEDPWEEHARYFPECYFLRLVKGNDFVQRYSLQYNFEKCERSTEEKKIKKKKDKIKKDKKSKKEDDTFVCKICYNKPLSVIFLPCLHMITCVKCAPAIDKCIICRVHIPGVIQPIIS
ncbi:E3 ubiquitin-protein ligase XIAP-like [Aphidius gifuensis]|uniref:E3 ubiquitin-protein ligase XIAP-like n=1 Tax=Aphidius gifuensis TaxID=684658 RepID=UPI001CDC1D09|nr:E3 ubiquitin-protein ligase XIAP-like [Aphidius gifuensis]